MHAYLMLLSLTLLSQTVIAANQEGEEVPSNEAQAIREVVALIQDQVTKDAKKEGHAFRDAHRKHHGCVQARFTVLGDLPLALRQGLFSEGKTYPAVIRYSNGSGQEQDDRKGDGRGMAIKVMGVSGARNLTESDDEKTSQDFLMINHPVFFVRNAADYVGFQKAVQKGEILWWVVQHAFHEGAIAKAIQDKKMLNPLDASYFSTTPSKLGPSQMKFRAIPCQGSSFESPSQSVNRLRENLAASLAARDACFLFQVQLREDSHTMPIEDPTIEWKERDAPFHTVAKISIPRQKAELGESCEVLSYNPWNGLASMRPLGGISRARKEVYQTISRLRHDINRQRRGEPELK